jgi:4-hydroxy-tetrahydrodipicolinate reductase
MADIVRVVILGSGATAAELARQLRDQSGIELCGVYARRAERRGQDLGTLHGAESPWGVVIGGELAEVLAAGRPDIVIQATGRTLTDVSGELETCLRASAALISLADDMIYPAARDAALAQQLERQAQQQGVAVLGLGLNPGFVQDVLVLLLSGASRAIQSIRIERISDLSAADAATVQRFGVGLSESAFADGLQNGSVTAYRGGRLSLQLIADRLGWALDRIEETYQPAVSRLPRRATHASIPPTFVAGCHSVVSGYRGDTALITIVNHDVVHPYLDSDEPGDRITIEGTPAIQIQIKPELPRLPASCALAINLIPQVLALAPGLYNLADLPPARPRNGGVA